MFTLIHVLVFGFVSWAAATGEAQRSWLHSAVTQLKVSLLKGFPSGQLIKHCMPQCNRQRGHVAEHCAVTVRPAQAVVFLT